jgi:hypothetical protein
MSFSGNVCEQGFPLPYDFNTGRDDFTISLVNDKHSQPNPEKALQGSGYD